MKRFLTTAVVVALAGFVFAGCGGSDKKTSTTTTAAASGTTLSLVATNFQFDHTTLTATAGEAVTLEIKNDGTVDHNLTVADLSVNIDAKPGKSATQTVTPAAGTYQYHCEYHPTQMTGTLTVS